MTMRKVLLWGLVALLVVGAYNAPFAFAHTIHHAAVMLQQAATSFFRLFGSL